jgi:hypothetical protein
LGIQTLPSSTSKLADVSALIFPAKQAAASVSNVTLAKAFGFLVQNTVRKNTAVINTIDITDGNFMLNITEQKMLYPQHLHIAFHDYLRYLTV